MKTFMFLAVMLLSVSCSHRSHYQELRTKVEKLEAKNLKEIRSDMESVLENHPELDTGTKKQISQLMERALTTHQNLRDQESKLIQLMLERTISNETQVGFGERKAWRGELKEVYGQKGDNILSLITEIKQISEKSPADENFMREMEIIFREMR